MDRAKGIAFRGLACAVCSENNHCPRCRSNGCTNKESCKNYLCCRTKGLDRCWECGNFPCSGTILDKPRIRAVARFARNYGVERLIECLARNERAGIEYHYPGKLTEDYDLPDSEAGITSMILDGRILTTDIRRVIKSR